MWLPWLPPLARRLGGFPSLNFITSLYPLHRSRRHLTSPSSSLDQHYQHYYRAMSASIERAAEISQSLAEIKSRVHSAARARSSTSASEPTLVAVSKYKPASDILTCYEDGQLDFGENYVQEVVDKAHVLPKNIRWHFIGTLQSNKAKTLAAIPNLHTVQTLTSIKTAKLLDKALPADRSPPGTPLNVFIQVNTSGEDTKSGLAPLVLASSTDTDADADTAPKPKESDLFQLARSIITECPRLHLQGLMTIGALERSLQQQQPHDASDGSKNLDFERLRECAGVLQALLVDEFGPGAEGERKWGSSDEGGGRLLLSMGMSSDFEAAIEAGSDIVRVGTGIFGERAKKGGG